MLENQVVRQTLATYLVDQLYANVNVAGALKSGLPPQLQQRAAWPPLDRVMTLNPIIWLLVILTLNLRSTTGRRRWLLAEGRSDCVVTKRNNAIMR